MLSKFNPRRIDGWWQKKYQKNLHYIPPKIGTIIISHFSLYCKFHKESTILLKKKNIT